MGYPSRMGEATEVALLLCASGCLGLRVLLGAAETAIGNLPLARVRILAADRLRARAVLAVKLDLEATWWTERLLGQLLFAAGTALAGQAAVVSRPRGGGAFWLAALAAAIVALGLELGLRSLAARRAEVWALALGPPVRLIVRLLGPVHLATTWIVERLVRPLGGGRPSLAPAIPSFEDLEAYLTSEAGRGQLGRTDPELLRSILEFSDKTAREVMVPRTGIVAVEIDTPPEEVVRLLEEHGHSRLPVYRESIDNIVGILHSRDLVPLLSNPQLIVISDLLRPATFVPWAQRVGALLREMQRRRVHLAVVVDEYGGVMGIVTLEDILEEIVGEIEDELAPAGRGVELAHDGSALVRGGISIDEFGKAFGLAFGGGEFETLAGWLNAQAGAIPEQGDRFFANGLQLTVVDRSPRRVLRVKVLRLRGKPPRQQLKSGGDPR